MNWGNRHSSTQRKELEKDMFLQENVVRQISWGKLWGKNIALALQVSIIKPTALVKELRSER